jgi:hypothetical protein
MDDQGNKWDRLDVRQRTWLALIAVFGGIVGAAVLFGCFTVVAVMGLILALDDLD